MRRAVGEPLALALDEVEVDAIERLLDRGGEPVALLARARRIAPGARARPARTS